jgi:hypothetical protein
MASEAGQTIYRERAATAECANAGMRAQGLYRVSVRGAIKLRAVALLHALAFNLKRLLHIPLPEVA